MFAVAKRGENTGPDRGVQCPVLGFLLRPEPDHRRDAPHVSASAAGPSMPPSTASDVPVVEPAAGEAR